MGDAPREKVLRQGKQGLRHRKLRRQNRQPADANLNLNLNLELDLNLNLNLDLDMKLNLNLDANLNLNQATWNLLKPSEGEGKPNA